MQYHPTILQCVTCSQYSADYLPPFGFCFKANVKFPLINVYVLITPAPCSLLEFELTLWQITYFLLFIALSWPLISLNVGRSEGSLCQHDCISCRYLWSHPPSLSFGTSGLKGGVNRFCTFTTTSKERIIGWKHIKTTWRARHKSNYD